MQLNRFESELVLYLIESTLVILHGNSDNIWYDSSDSKATNLSDKIGDTVPLMPT